MGKSGDFMSDKIKLPVVDTLTASLKYPVTNFFQLLKVFLPATLVVYGPIVLLGWWAWDTMLKWEPEMLKKHWPGKNSENGTEPTILFP